MSMNTVLLYAGYTDQLSYYDDWVDAFRTHAVFATTAIDVCSTGYDCTRVSESIEQAEVIVLHHSMTGDTLEYLTPLLETLHGRNGKLIAFVGNEVNLPILGMAPKIALLKALQVDIIATQLLLEAGEWLYSDCGARIISLPHALNKDKFFAINEPGHRNIDVGTRSARYGSYIGDNERNAISQFFYHNASKYGLRVDLGLNAGDTQRFNRDEWSAFLNQCKATLSTEAGSFYLQKDDAIINRMQLYFVQQQSKFIVPKHGWFVNLYRRLASPSVKQVIRRMFGKYMIDEDKVLEALDYAAVHEQFFKHEDRCHVYSKAISSRHFDAIGTKTLHVMYPGRYNDILQAGEHYFELRRDHSNVDELLQLLADQKRIAEITNNAYEYVVSQHTHKHRLDTLAAFINNTSLIN